MEMKKGKVAGEGRERAPDEKALLFPGHNRPIGFAMVLAEKPEALMTNQK